MKFIPTMVLAAMLGWPIGLQAEAHWGTDLPAAQEKAKAEGKLVVLNFTGSDWCGWCMKLKAEVFSRPEFEAYAKENLVLVEVDFPRGKAQSDSLKKANQALMKKYDIEGYPTIIVLDGAGRKLGKLGYQPGGPKPFVEEIHKLGGNRLRRPVATGAIPVATQEVTHTPPSLTGLELHGIAGPKSHRMAILNTTTLSAGEGAIIQLSDRRAKIRCLEVRERSILVSIDNEKEPVEIQMRKGL